MHIVLVAVFARTCRWLPEPPAGPVPGQVLHLYGLCRAELAGVQVIRGSGRQAVTEHLQGTEALIVIHCNYINNFKIHENNSRQADILDIKSLQVVLILTVIAYSMGRVIFIYLDE